MTKKKKELTGIHILILLFFASLGLFLIFSIMDWATGNEMSCKISSLKSSELYCLQIPTSNMSNGGYHWEQFNKTEQKIARDNYVRKQEELRKEKEAEQICYNQGYDFEMSFDIMEDYGLSCPKLKYVNDHFIDNFEKKNVGYIRGSYSGFLSHGSLDGEFYQYINNKIMATGNLVENISYHVDCEGTKHNEQIDYYDTGEFVMYYVEECI